MENKTFVIESFYLHVCMYLTVRECVFLLFIALIDRFPYVGLWGRHAAGETDSTTEGFTHLILISPYNTKHSDRTSVIKAVYYWNLLQIYCELNLHSIICQFPRQIQFSYY